MEIFVTVLMMTWVVSYESAKRALKKREQRRVLIWLPLSRDLNNSNSKLSVLVQYLGVCISFYRILFVYLFV